MPVTQAQIAHIARNLSKLGISDADLVAHECDMNAIIGYIDHIGKIPDLDTVTISDTLTLQPVADGVHSNDITPHDLLAQSPKKVMGGQIVIDGIM